MAYTTIDDPSAYFKAQLYTGNGSTQSITFDDTDTDMEPDFVMLKGRDVVAGLNVHDSVRGVNKQIYTNTSDAEETLTTTLTAFNSDGFSLGSNGNANSDTKLFVAWCWKETADAGFDIVSYTGNATARTISHNLSAVPHWMVVKNRGSDVNWTVYHHKNTSAPETDRLLLNTDAATGDSDAEWNDTAPTSSVFSVGTGDSPNKDGDAIIAYLWSGKQGFSKFGSYTGNNNADGAFEFTGFRPAFVLIKNATDGADWTINDIARDPHNVNNLRLFPNDNKVESSGSLSMDMLSNGFKLRSTDSGNNGPQTYIYAAFAAAPFVNSNGVPCNAR